MGLDGWLRGAATIRHAAIAKRASAASPCFTMLPFSATLLGIWGFIYPV